MMTRISLTVWFGDDEKDILFNGQGIVGHLTDEQYEMAMKYLKQMARWTDENRRKRNEID